MKALLIAFLTTAAFLPTARAQSLPAVYLNAHDEETVPDSATHYRVVDRKKGEGGYAMRDYALNGTLLLRGTLTGLEPAVRNGLFTWYHPNGNKSAQVHYHNDEADGVYVSWYEDGKVSQRGEYADGMRTGKWLSVHRNGQKRSEGSYVASRPHGEWRYYYDTGQLSAVERLENGRSTNLKFFNLEGELYAGVPRRRQGAEFPGGQAALMQYLARNTTYSRAARRKNITGKVYVSYTVGEDGRISQVRVVRGLAPEVDIEARRVVAALPAFKPGREYNVPTAMTYTLPIMFAPNFKLFGGVKATQTPPTEARASNPDDSY